MLDGGGAFQGRSDSINNLRKDPSSEMSGAEVQGLQCREVKGGSWELGRKN